MPKRKSKKVKVREYYRTNPKNIFSRIANLAASIKTQYVREHYRTKRRKK